MKDTPHCIFKVLFPLGMYRTLLKMKQKHNTNVNSNRNHCSSYLDCPGNMSGCFLRNQYKQQTMSDMMLLYNHSYSGMEDTDLLTDKEINKSIIVLGCTCHHFLLLTKLNGWVNMIIELLRRSLVVFQTLFVRWLSTHYNRVLMYVINTRVGMVMF